MTSFIDLSTAPLNTPYSAPSETAVQTPLQEEINLNHSVTIVKVNQPLLHQTASDRLLSQLQSLGIIDAQWRLQKTYTDKSIEDLKCDPKLELFFLQLSASEEGNLPSFEKLLEICYNVATQEGAIVNSYRILGSYVPFLIGKESLKNFLIGVFPGLDSYFEECHVAPAPYNDIDIRIDASHNQLVVRNFNERLCDIFGDIIKLTPPNVKIDLEKQRVILDVENVKMGLADITYCRCAEQEEVRAEHQKVMIELMPFHDKFAVVGSMQSVLDLYCGIGHWNKTNNNEWDFCAYILMITRGIRFPDDESERELLETGLKCKGNNLEKLMGVVTHFKKLDELKTEVRVLYALNCCEILKPDLEGLKTLLNDLHPTSHQLQKLIEVLLEGSLSYVTATAVLQIVAVRILAYKHPSDLKLPFKIAIVAHKGRPHLQFTFKGGHFTIELNLKQSWLEVIRAASASDEATQSIIGLIAAFGRMRDFEFSDECILKKDADALKDVLQIDLEEMIPHLTSDNKAISRLSVFLFTFELFRLKSKKNLMVALEHGDRPLLKNCDIYHQFYEIVFSIAQKFHGSDRKVLEEGLNLYFYTKMTRYELAEKLIYISPKAIFMKAIQWRDVRKIPSLELVNHHLNKGQSLHVLTLLEIISERSELPLMEWVRLIKACREMLTVKPITVDNCLEVNAQAKILSKIVLKLLKEHDDKSGLKADLEWIEGLFLETGLQEEAKRIGIYLKIWNHREELAALRLRLQEFVRHPTLEEAIAILSITGSVTNEIRTCFSDWIRDLKFEQKPVLFALMSEVRFRQLYESPAEKRKLINLLMNLVKAWLSRKEIDSESVMQLIKFNDVDPIRIHKSYLMKLHEHGTEPVRQETGTMLSQIKDSIAVTDPEYFDLFFFFFKEQFENSKPFSYQRLLDSWNAVSPHFKDNQVLEVYRYVITHPRTTTRFIFISKLASYIRRDLDKRKTLRDEYYNLNIKYIVLGLSNFLGEFTDISYYLNQLIENKEVSKQQQQELKEALVIAVTTKPDFFEYYSPPIFPEIFHNLLNNVHRSPFAAELLDVMMEYAPQKNMHIELLEGMGNLALFYPQESKATLPQCYYKALHKLLEGEMTVDKLKEASRYISTKAFYHRSEITPYREVYVKYCKAYFSLLFKEKTSFFTSIAEIYLMIFNKYSDRVKKPATPQSGKRGRGLEAIKTSEYFEFFRQLNMMTCGQSLIQNLWLNIINTLMLNWPSPTGAIDEFEQILLTCLESKKSLIDSKLANIILFEETVNSIPSDVAIYIAQALMELPSTNLMMVLLRTNFMLVTALDLSDRNIEAASKILGACIFSDRNQIDGFAHAIFNQMIECVILKQLGFILQPTNNKSITFIRANLVSWLCLISEDGINLFIQVFNLKNQTNFIKETISILSRVVEILNDRDNFLYGASINRVLNLGYNTIKDTHAELYIQLLLAGYQRFNFAEQPKATLLSFHNNVLVAFTRFPKDKKALKGKEKIIEELLDETYSFTKSIINHLSETDDVIKVLVTFLLTLHTMRTMSHQSNLDTKIDEIFESILERVKNEINTFHTNIHAHRENPEECLRIFNEFWEQNSKYYLLLNELNCLGFLHLQEEIWTKIYNHIIEICQSMTPQQRYPFLELLTKVLERWKGTMNLETKKDITKSVIPIFKLDRIAFLNIINQFLPWTEEIYSTTTTLEARTSLMNRLIHLYMYNQNKALKCEDVEDYAHLVYCKFVKMVQNISPDDYQRIIIPIDEFHKNTQQLLKNLKQ